MSSPLTVLERSPVPGGEARLLAIDGIARRFQVELGTKLFSVDWDPRETMSNLFVKLEWSQPAKTPIDAADVPVVLDGLWTLAPLARGVGAIIDEGGKHHVILRWSRPTAFFVRIGYVDGGKGPLEYLELGRTMIAEMTEGAAGPPRVANVRTDTMKWVHPTVAPLTDADIAHVKARLESAEQKDFILTDFRWKIQVTECP